MKTYKTRTNAALAAERVVADWGQPVNGKRVSYVITSEADGRFAPLYFAEDTQTSINIAMAGHGRSMQGWVPPHFQNGDVKSF
jgi:hypothetical protein